MSDTFGADRISRRSCLSFVGLAAALGFAAPAAVLTASDAEAQTVGMERRHSRREGRHERREGRRDARHARREGRHSARETRRDGRNAQ